MLISKKILFLAANPEGMDSLALDEEARQIRARLRAADHRDFELIPCGAVQWEDILQGLHEHKPHIVHFSGHGTGQSGIVLLDAQRRAKPVSATALKQLFATLKDNVRVVVLNACYSRAQAEAITEVIDCAIGMNDEIGDEAAIVFAATFYQALAFRRSVQEAFDLGKTALMMEGVLEQHAPELLVRQGIVAEKLFVVDTSGSGLPTAQDPAPLKAERGNRSERTNAKRRVVPEIRLTVFSAICLGIALSAAAASFFVGRFAALLAPLPLLVAAYHWRSWWVPRFSQYGWTQVVTLAAVYLSSACYLLPAGPDPYLRLNYVGPAFVLVAGLVTTASIRRREVTWAKANPDLEAPYVSYGDFRVSLERYCDALVAELDRYDREVNWSDRELTPLEAEVEAEATQRSRPGIASDLVEAIRRDRRSGVFVVLGDPGSGKSVSLRRLVRVLCSQAAQTGVVPVYVNLREYPADDEPTPEALLKFVREVTWRQTGRDGRAFLDTWYEAFRKSGRLFFVIDSFDELPAVLDSDEKSATHRRVSAAFDRFFTQEILTCRVVLASRQFRAPVDVVGTRLVIRPFSEMQVRTAMRTWLQGKGIDTLTFVRRLFQTRPHLVPLLRNPFTAELIAEWATAGHGNELPLSMYEVFDEYLTRRLEGDQRSARSGAPDAAEVRAAAGRIATEMYRTKAFGLEADLEAVVAVLQPIYGDESNAIIEALRYARLARVGGADRRRFSFVHRRFAEFFVVDAFRNEGGTIELNSIPTDSRWRDCLVMCCGVIELKLRREVAEYCWSVISESRDAMRNGWLAQSQAAVHCIRFLADAFRSDPDALKSFRGPLTKLVDRLLCGDDLLVAKIAAELIPLVNDDGQQEAIVDALARRSRWVSDTTLNACRHLSQILPATHDAIRAYIHSFTVPELFRRYRDLQFSLNLSEAFRPSRRALTLAVAEVVTRGVLALAVLTVSIIDSPGMLVFPVVLVTICWGFDYWMVHMVGLDDRGVLWFRDWVDAGSRLLMFGVPMSYLLERATRRNSEIDLWPGAGPGELASRAGEGWWLVSFAVLFLLSFRWENLFQQGQLLQARVRSRLASPSPHPPAKPSEPEKDVGPGPFSPIRAFVREPTWKNAKPLTWAIGIASAPVVLVFGLTRLWSLLTPFVKDLLKALLLVSLAGFVLFLLGRVALARSRQTVVEIRERRARRRMGSPESISCETLYRYLSSLRSVAVRAEVLRELRFRRCKLKGDLCDPPKALLKNVRVAEELARLREQWLGLE